MEEVITQSNLTSKGLVCIFLQEKFLPLNGMSTRSRSEISSLNIFILVISPPGLFLLSDEIKVTSKDLVLKISGVKIHEPSDEALFLRIASRSINVGEKEGFIVKSAKEFNCDSIGVSLDDCAIKETAVPHSEKAPRSTSGGEEGKLIQTSKTEFLNVKSIKFFSLGFL